MELSPSLHENIPELEADPKSIWENPKARDHPRLRGRSHKCMGLSHVGWG